MPEYTRLTSAQWKEGEAVHGCTVWLTYEVDDNGYPDISEAVVWPPQGYTLVRAGLAFWPEVKCFILDAFKWISTIGASAIAIGLLVGGIVSTVIACAFVARHYSVISF